MTGTMTYLPFELGELTPALEHKAEKELGETAEAQREALADLKTLLKSETKLTCSDDDKHLTKFLRARKYNVKRAFTLLKNFYQAKNNYPEVYSSDFEGLKISAINKFFSILPNRDKNGEAILICNFDGWHLNERKFCSVLHDLTLAALLMLEEPASQVSGFKIIYDLRPLSLNHLLEMHPKYIALVAHGIKNCLPMRIKEFHVVNESSVFQYIWVPLKYLAGEKLRKRVHLHSTNLDSMHQYISPEILPVEYGGKVVYDVKYSLRIIEKLKNVYDQIFLDGYKS